MGSQAGGWQWQKAVGENGLEGEAEENIQRRLVRQRKWWAEPQQLRRITSGPVIATVSL